MFYSYLDLRSLQIEIDTETIDAELTTAKGVAINLRLNPDNLAGGDFQLILSPKTALKLCNSLHWKIYGKNPADPQLVKKKTTSVQQSSLFNLRDVSIAASVDDSSRSAIISFLKSLTAEDAGISPVSSSTQNFEK